MDSNSLNPHCKRPTLVKESDKKWYIKMYFDSPLKKSDHKKFTGELNDKDLVQGYVKGISKAIKERERLASDFKDEIKDLLKTHYFNPITKSFEIADKSKKDFLNILDDFIKSKKGQNLDDDTISGYESQINVIKTYFELNKLSYALGQIKVPIVVSVLDGLRVLRGWDGTHTWNKYLIFFKTVMEWCVLMEYLEKNPILRISPLKKTEIKSNKPISKDNFSSVLSDIRQNDKQLFLLTVSIYCTLARNSEILRLQKRDIDFESGKVVLTITKQTDEVITYRETKFEPPILEFIKNNIDLNSVPDDWYFLGNHGKARIGRATTYNNDIFAPFSNEKTRTYNSKWDTTRKRLDIPKGHTIYAAKHRGVLDLIEDWDTKHIMAYSGHKRESTLGIYARGRKPKLKSRDDIQNLF